MKGPRMHSLCWLTTLCVPGSCITLLGVLQSQPKLSTLYSYVNASSNASSLLANANEFTFLAPSNTAIASLLANDPSAFAGGNVDALLQYSLLTGGYPTLSITNSSQFIATGLSNATYANVTGGQTVELVLGSNGESEVITGNKSISESPTELICIGGYVRVIEQVLTIPLTTVLMLTAANLEFFTSILNVGNYLNTANAGYVNGILEVPDVTYFIPNSAAALANATAVIKANGSSEALQALFEYHIVPNFVGYSTLLKNGTNLKTAQGDNLTITIQGEDIFVNAAKIITTDLLVANGVVHVLDDLLNRFDQSAPPPLAAANPTRANSTPSTSPAPFPTIAGGSSSSPTQASAKPAQSSKGLSTGAEAGIGFGAAVAGLAILAGVAFFLLRRKKNNQQNAVSDRGSTPSGSPEMENYYGKKGNSQGEHGVGLGLQDTHGTNEYRTSPPFGGVDFGNKASVTGPDIPPKSPSRPVRGGTENNF